MDYELFVVSPEDIADAMIAEGDAEEADRDDLENALYQLKAIAENKYNADYWRTFYKKLQNIVIYR